MRHILMVLALAGALGAQNGTVIRDSGWPASYGSCSSIFLLADDIDGRLVPVPCGDMEAHKAGVEVERKRRADVNAAEARLVAMEKAIEALRAQVAALIAKLEAK